MSAQGLSTQKPIERGTVRTESTPAVEHPLQIYFATVSGSQVVRIRYGTIDGVVPPEVQGGSGATDWDDSARKYWAVTGYDDDGQTGTVSIGSGASVPADTTTNAYQLIGEVQSVSGTPTIQQAASASLQSFRCGEDVYSWGSI